MFMVLFPYWIDIDLFLSILVYLLRYISTLNTMFMVLFPYWIDIDLFISQYAR